MSSERHFIQDFIELLSGKHPQTTLSIVRFRHEAKNMIQMVRVCYFEYAYLNFLQD